MATKVIMPQLGESVVEGTVTKWLKGEGDQVDEFEPLLEVNTDKVDTEVPSPETGTVLKVYVPEGETVKAGTLLAMIGMPGDETPPLPEGKPAAEPVATASKAERPRAVEARPAAPKAGKDVGFISPVVARMASEHNIDLTSLVGTGRGGRITKKDVQAHLEQRKGAPEGASLPWEQPASGELFRPTEEVFGAAERSVAAGAPGEPGTILPLDVVRRTIAEHMLRSSRTSPHVTTVMEVDLSRVVAHRQMNKAAYAQEGINLTYTPYFVAAVVRGLKEAPIVNSSWSEDGIVLHREVNIGVAVSLGEKGLIVPVIKEADQKSLRGLAAQVSDLAERARMSRLVPDEVQGGTFTITNHGVAGSLFATPIINQPQCAILGVGAIQKRVVVVEAGSHGGGGSDALAIKPMLYLSLSFDHRILDGAMADQFLGIVVEALERWS